MSATRTYSLAGLPRSRVVRCVGESSDPTAHLDGRASREPNVAANDLAVEARWPAELLAATGDRQPQNGTGQPSAALEELASDHH